MLVVQFYSWCVVCAIISGDGYRLVFFFFQAEDGIRDLTVTGVQTCALPIFAAGAGERRGARRADVARADEEGPLGLSRGSDRARRAGGGSDRRAVPSQHDGRRAPLGGGARDLAASPGDRAARS